MLSKLYWIDAEQATRLAIMARPRAGDWLEDEVAHWKHEGVETVISLLQRDEVDELGLGAEAAVCEANGIEYLSFPIPDRGLPDNVNFALDLAANVAVGGKSTAIHCRAGIGRSSIMAAAVLISSGVDAHAALTAIAQARGLSIPDTDVQRDWVLSLERS